MCTFFLLVHSEFSQPDYSHVHHAPRLRTTIIFRYAAVTIVVHYAFIRLLALSSSLSHRVRVCV